MGHLFIAREEISRYLSDNRTKRKHSFVNVGKSEVDNRTTSKRCDFIVIRASTVCFGVLRGTITFVKDLT